MLSYVVGRAGEALVVIVAATVLIFLSVHLIPGDPVQVMFGELGADPEHLRELRTRLGLDAPLLSQYLRYMLALAQGNLGTSIRQEVPVLDMVRDEIWYTVQLALAGLAFAGVTGASLGILAAVKRHSFWDTLAMGIAVIGLSIPTFSLGLLLIFIFAYKLGVVRITEITGVASLVLPGLTLGLWAAGSIARIMRTSMLEVLGQEYIRTAQAKGVREALVVGRHALRNALIPVMTVFGIQFGHMLSGAVIVESVFARPGLGRLLTSAILSKDFPVVQGTVLVAVLVFIAINFSVDLSYGWLDPRVRFG